MSPEKNRDISFETAKDIARSEPNRVLINAGGEAIPMKRALQQGIVADLIFVRNDGWSLGAPGYLEQEAYSLWSDEWLLIYHVPTDVSLPAPFYLASGARFYG
jgi:hypothetical protein